MGTFRNKVINHGGLLQVEGRKLTIELNESYPYQAEVLLLLGKLRSEAKMKKFKSSFRALEEKIVLEEVYDAQNNAEILNDSVLSNIVEYIGINGIVDRINDIFGDAINNIIPCNSDIFPLNAKIQLIQDFR